MNSVRAVMQRVAATDLSVLLTGETGVGKEVVAREIYAWSERSRQPFVKINSPGLPDRLFESELFGYEAGAFTGAVTRREGLIRRAHRGTLFFDEVAELNSAAQSKLLQILQEKQFTPLGADTPVWVDVRILSATNRELNRAVEEGSFRRDLFYRLNVVHIHVPPLRERPEDLEELSRLFLDKYKTQFNKPEIPSFSARDIERLRGYHWPGNVRELENFVKNLVLTGESQTALEQLSHRVRRSNGSVDSTPSLLDVARRIEREVERKVIRNTLTRTGWNRRRTAQMLKISYRSLLTKIKKLEIR